MVRRSWTATRDRDAALFCPPLAQPRRNHGGGVRLRRGATLAAATAGSRAYRGAMAFACPSWRNSCCGGSRKGSPIQATAHDLAEYLERIEPGAADLRTGRYAPGACP